MSRIASLDPASATGRAAELLAATEKQLGRAPNLYRSMAQSPAALDGYLALRAALGKGVLSTRMKEQIALLVAALNGCDYCVAAHTFRGGKIGMAPHDLALTQLARSFNPADQVALEFVRTLVEQRGRISDAGFAAMQQAGWDDAAIGEIVGQVALNVFSNYFNHVATPALDFPAPVQELHA
ncbi:MAG: carboxymuconolactone decarboxylase family protein [Pseudomonadota bacterium]